MDALSDADRGEVTHAQPPGRHTPPRRRVRGGLKLERWLPAVLLTLMFTGCAVSMAVALGRRTGLSALAVGVALAMVPMPLVVGAVVWLGRVRPQPRTHLLFAFGWGSCGGALVALLANSWSYRWLVDTTGQTSGERLSADLVAPLVEEAVKATAVVMLLVGRRRWFHGPLDTLVVTGVSAAGFAFTENVLYFARAFAHDASRVNGGPPTGSTMHTFVVRAVMSPLAHPLFTAMTGLGLGLALHGGSRRRLLWCGCSGGVLAVGVHSAWNGSTRGGAAFVAVYVVVMAPLLASLVVLAVRLRRNQLRAVTLHLPSYAAAGWLLPHEPAVLRTMASRAWQRRAARTLGGTGAVNAVCARQWDATALAELRHRASHHAQNPGFTARERELLGRLWTGRAPLRALLAQAPYSDTAHPVSGPAS